MRPIPPNPNVRRAPARTNSHPAVERGRTPVPPRAAARPLHERQAHGATDRPRSADDNRGRGGKWFWLVRLAIVVNIVLALGLIEFAGLVREEHSSLVQAFSEDFAETEVESFRLAKNWLESSNDGRAFLYDGFWTHADGVGWTIVGVGLAMLVLTAATSNGFIRAIATVYGSPGLALLAGGILVLVGGLVAAVAYVFLLAVIAALFFLAIGLLMMAIASEAG